MIRTPWSALVRVANRSTNSVRSALLFATLVALAACSDGGIVEPGRTGAAFVNRANADVVVTPNYSAFDVRTQFNGAGAIDHQSDFEELTGELVHILPSPWTASGVTYTSAFNLVFSPDVGFGVQSNAMGTEYGLPITATFGADDAFTMLGVDVALIGSKTPIGLVVTTNLSSYSFPNLDIPLATTGTRFLGLALSQTGEYLTGFQLTNSNSETILLIDNVAVGHAGSVSANASPVASVGGAYSGAEGSSIALAMSASDADNDVLTFAWDLGDGTTGSGATPPTTHTYADNGTYEILLAVDDGRGGVDTARTTATIANVAPSMASFAVPTTPIALNAGVATISVSTTFSDPGSDTHVATLDCGDGTLRPGSVPNGTAGGTCTFSSAGVYTVQLSVQDDDGDSDTKLATGQVVVYDASAGWITGGGWINSPAGAYVLVPSVSGKLTFGFVAKYQPFSVAIPTGNAEFKLNVGKLDFRSTTLDWLVVSGSTAQLQGSGTLNGTGKYGFSLTTVDGAPADAIRIRIWNRVSGELVYDNQPGSPADSEDATPLGGGSIQIHSR